MHATCTQDDLNFTTPEKWRILAQNGISRLYNLLEIYHSGPEPLKCLNKNVSKLDGQSWMARPKGFWTAVFSVVSSNTYEFQKIYNDFLLLTRDLDSCFADVKFQPVLNFALDKCCRESDVNFEHDQ